MKASQAAELTNTRKLKAINTAMETPAFGVAMSKIERAIEKAAIKGRTNVTVWHPFPGWKNLDVARACRSKLNEDEYFCALIGFTNCNHIFYTYISWE